jgi:uncharacterized protein YneF (UPF0154 family)
LNSGIGRIISKEVVWEEETMKKVLLMGVLCLVIGGIGGCFVSVKDGCHSREGMHEPMVDSTIAEIEAVRMLASESGRLNVLRAIAGRPGLSPEARIHLVEACRMLASESSREEILMILAENPPMPPGPMPKPEPCDDEDDD